MADRDKHETLDDLGRRIAGARQAREPRPGGDRGRGRETGSGLGLGLRLATEMVAALIVGVGLGLGLDRWLDTGPWLLIVFFVLGSAAGMMNVIRVAQAHDAARRRARSEDKGGEAENGAGGTKDRGDTGGRD